MKDLRERTIDLIKTEGNFDMEVYKPAHCETACCIAGNICIAAGLDIRNIHSYYIAGKARELWAESYGWKEADRLEFTETGWGDDLESVTPEEAIAHLNGAPPVRHDLNDEDLDD